MRIIPSIEHPRTSELPKDVLSEEELKKRGIEIIQADNTNLYIREGAFAQGEPLADFNNGDRELTIVLINGPVVSPYFMSDPKYAEVKKLLPEEIRKEESIVQYREKRVKEQELQVEYFRQDAKELAEEIQTQQNPSQHLLDKLSEAKGQVLLHKLFVEMYKNVITEKDILAEMALTSQSRDKAGLHQVLYGNSLTFFSDGSRTENRSIVDATIFLAVGQVENQRYKVIYFMPEGEIGSLIWSSGLGEDLRPLSRQTHPNLKDFHINSMASPEDPLSYPYGAQTPGQTLRHEVQHDLEKREGWVKEGRTAENNEYNTDMKAMETIRQAWEKWENSGFKNNSGYYFVFSLPEGGYILTKHEPSDSTTSATEII